MACRRSRFCVSVQHAHDVAKQFRDAGYPAMALDGGTDREIRRGVVRDFPRAQDYVARELRLVQRRIRLSRCARRPNVATLRNPK